MAQVDSSVGGKTGIN
ncbi:hypothetical protein, partial [Mesorhizobium sp.]